jgi:hypothetical protein
MEMEKKTLIMVLVGTLIGLLVGVGLGYLAASPLQPPQSQDLQNQIAQKDSQIQALQQKVSDLETLLGPIKKGDWNLIKTFQGSSGVKTDYFYVGGSELRISWTWVSSNEQYASFNIYLYKQGQSSYTEAFLFLQDNGTTFAHNIASASHYLDITEANLDQWTVSVEVWIPK